MLMKQKILDANEGGGLIDSSEPLPRLESGKEGVGPRASDLGLFWEPF
jgi:hypothetical protein